jgi:DNA-binding GntR family transcriptional regulator
LSSAADEIFRRVCSEASLDPEMILPNVYEIGKHLGYSRELVKSAVEQLVRENLVRWRTNEWVELTALGVLKCGD